jgi:serine/threonine protein phosphatase PrpC
MIAEIVSQQKNIDEIARELVARAVEIDGNDNTTAQVIRVRSVEQVGMYRGRPYSPAFLDKGDPIPVPAGLMGPSL